MEFFCMHNKEKNQKIKLLLKKINRNIILNSECFFGGGSALSMFLDDYRESSDIDFLCSSEEGYRELRNHFFENNLKDLFDDSVEVVRDFTMSNYAVRGALKIDDMVIKFEIINEGRIKIEGEENSSLSVPTLTRLDFFTQKLLSNVDRWADRGVKSRDMIDLLVMRHHWGEIPKKAWEKAGKAYSPFVVEKAYENALNLLRNEEYLKSCFKELNIDENVESIIRSFLIEKKLNKTIIKGLHR